MTIEINGFVKALETHSDKDHTVAITIQLELSRYGDYTVMFYATEAETAVYRPGMPVILQVRPNPERKSQP